MHWQDQARQEAGGVGVLALTTLALAKAAAERAIETDARQVDLEQTDGEDRIRVTIKR
jgi:hypothetical protein